MNFLYLKPTSLKNTCEKSSLLLNMNTLAPCQFPITLIPFACIFQGFDLKSVIGILHKNYLIGICDRFYVLNAS